MSERKKRLFISISLFVLSVVYTFLVWKVDVSSIGPRQSEVGFSTLNDFFHNLTGYNPFFYSITKYLGFIPFLYVAYYGINGLLQIVRRKSILKVDKRLLFLGCFYLLMGITYVFFEKVVINYRPVLLEGVLEASYPSSHTMLAICICTSSLLISKYYIKDVSIRNGLDKFTWGLMAILVLGRTLSGVHWLTDIIGGIVISLFLVSLYWFFIFEKK